MQPAIDLASALVDTIEDGTNSVTFYSFIP